MCRICTLKRGNCNVSEKKWVQNIESLRRKVCDHLCSSNLQPNHVGPSHSVRIGAKTLRHLQPSVFPCKQVKHISVVVYFKYTWLLVRAAPVHMHTRSLTRIGPEESEHSQTTTDIPRSLPLECAAPTWRQQRGKTQKLPQFLPERARYFKNATAHQPKPLGLIRTTLICFYSVWIQSLFRCTQS